MKPNVTFHNSRGYNLTGYWEVPEDREGPFPAVVFSHGRGSSKDSPRNAPIAGELLRNGVIAFRFDFTGHGTSDGTRGESTFDQQTDDLLWAIDYALRRHECSGVIGINGSSSGGRVALQVAIEGAPLAALALRSPRTDGLVRFAAMIAVPTLIIEGSNDPLLPASRELYEALEVPGKLVVVPDSGHIFEGPGAYEQVLKETVDWFLERLAGVPRAVVLGPEP